MKIKVIENFNEYMSKKSHTFQIIVAFSIVIVGMSTLIFSLIFFPTAVLIILVGLPIVILITTFILAQIDAKKSRGG